MKLLAVNHHYVAEAAPAAPRAIYPTTTADLERELEALGRSFEFVSRDDVLARRLPERACLITFDDGLRSQFELALPVLERLGVPALFLVAALPLAEGRALRVHAIHRLRERLGDEALLARLPVHELTPEERTRAEAMYGYDTPTAAHLKYALNVLGAGEAVDELLDEDLSELYMTREQVRELEQRHAAVGAHSYSHRPLARLAPDELREDLRRNVEVLAEVTRSPPRAISYPYGSPDAVSPDVAAAARAAGFELGFTMERTVNESFDEPLLLGRIDVNDVVDYAR